MKIVVAIINLVLFINLTLANDECSNAITLTPSTTCSYTSVTFNGMTISSSAPSCATSASQDVWYKFTATDSTMRVFITATSGLNHGFEIIQGGCGGTVSSCTNNSNSGFSETYFNNNFNPGQEYYVRVFNASSGLSTASFSICVQAYPSPANDACANAVPLTPNTSCNSTPVDFSGAMFENGTAPSCATSASQDVWYKFTATDSTMRILITATSGLNHGFEIIQGGCGGTVSSCVNSSGSGFSEIYFNNNFNPGQEYYVRVFNASSSLSTASFSICVQTYPSPTNDTCANAVTLTPNTSCNSTPVDFSGAMFENGTAPSCATSASQDVWYKFTATDSTMRILITATSGLNHGFEIIQGGCGGIVSSCVNSSGSGFSEIYFNNNFNPGQEYYVRVFNASSSLSTASFSICVQTYPSPTNDACANAVTLTPNTSCNSTPVDFSGAMFENGTAPSCATSASQDVWYKFTATDSTMRVFITATSGLNHGFEIIQGGCGGTVSSCTNNSNSGFSETYFNNNFNPGQEYYVRVFNASSGLSTASFSICVQAYPSPANDACANAITLTPNTSCNYASVDFSGAMFENGAAPSCATSASQDVWYKFTATDSTMRVFITATSGLNHGFEIIQGGCGGTVSSCTNNSNSGFSETYFNNNFNPGQEYYVRVFNASSGLSTASFSICVQAYPSPANDACANAITLTPNTSCNYASVDFSGAMFENGAAPSCATSASQDVWYKFTATDSTMRVFITATSGLNHGFEIIQGGCGGTVSSCTNNSNSGFSETYFNNNFNPGQEYYVRVFNASSGLSTASFSICVQNYPSPANDACANAITLTPNTSCNYASVDFSGAMFENGAAPSCATSASQDVWYKFTATDSTMRVFITATSGLNHGFEIIQGGCGGTVSSCTNNSNSGFSETYFNNNFNPGQEYYVRVFNTSSGLSTASFSICVQAYPSPTNDACANAITLTPNTSCNYTSATFSGAMFENGAAPSCATSASQDIWYTFTATESNMSINLSATSGINHGLQVFEGTCSGTEIICRNASGSGFAEYASLSALTVGQIYYVRVFNASSGLSTGTFSICVIGTPPTTCVPSITISSNQGNTICSGQQVIFSTTPTNGGTSPTYQWKKNGSNVGTGLTTYTTSTLVNGDIISCEFTSNAICANPTNATSNAITMTVSSSVTPSIAIASNQGNTICSGQQVIFSATPTNGGSMPTYQWKKNGGNVGTGLATYTTSTLTNGDVITCELTSSSTCASPTNATSNAITMTVSSSVTPSIAIASNQGNTICSGQQVIFSATPTNGGSMPTYQWKKNGSNVGTGLATYTTSTLVNGDVITCELTSSSTCASPTNATSNTITMTVESLPVVVITLINNELQATSGYTTYQWSLNGSQISGATGSIYIPTQNGEYTVNVTNDAGCEENASYSLNNLSIESSTINGSISCYPNPTTNTVVVNLQNYSDGELKIFDNTGRTLLIKSVHNGVNTVDLSTYETGIFHFSITIEGASKTIKVIKE